MAGRSTTSDNNSHRGVSPLIHAIEEQPRSTRREIREYTKTLREQLIWDLREGGYRFRDIAELLGITKQRASQIESGLLLRAITSEKGHDRDYSRRNAVRWKEKSHVRNITSDDFAKRLDALNDYYEAQLHRILKRGYNRQNFHKRAESPISTLFWKIWPLIELFELKPFSFSRLIGDFPSLAQQPHLPQLLFRLRRRGLLKKVGSVRIEGHNLSEVLMAQTPIEQYAAAKVEKLVVQWSRKLELLQYTYRPTRPVRSIQSLREDLLHILTDEGFSTAEIESIVGRRPIIQ